MQGVKRLILLFIGSWTIIAHASAPAISPRTVLPEWIENEDTLRYYIAQKYFGPPDACEPLDTGKWLCHISCGDACRIDSLFDVKAHRELTLPRTEAHYFLLPQWKRIVGIAFLPSASGWDLALVSLALDNLMVSTLPLFSTEHQVIRSFKLLPQGQKIGFDIRYCFEHGCWTDELRLKRGQMVLKSHRSE